MRSVVAVAVTSQSYRSRNCEQRLTPTLICDVSEGANVRSLRGAVPAAVRVAAERRLGGREDRLISAPAKHSTLLTNSTASQPARSPYLTLSRNP